MDKTIFADPVFVGEEELRGIVVQFGDTEDAFNAWLDSLSEERFAALIADKVGDQHRWSRSIVIAESTCDAYQDRFMRGE